MREQKASTTTEAENLGKTGERMVPQLHKGSLIYAEHYIRYAAAEELVRDKIVLDIACGSGYGTKMLSKHAKKVYGVDIDAPTIKYAEKNYGGRNIEYLVGNGEHIPLPDNSVDTAITFETIEHIKDYQGFISELKRVLKPDGLAIVSTPNDLEFAEGNHYHLHEFTYQELVGLLRQDFKNIESYFQATWKYVALGSAGQLQKEGQISWPNDNFAPPKAEEYLYFYLLCSNRAITEKVESLGALGAHYSDRQVIGKEMTHEQNIKDYRAVVKAIKADNKALQRDLEEIGADRNRLAAQLQAITNSRWYRTASKVKHTKRKLLG